MQLVSVIILVIFDFNKNYRETGYHTLPRAILANIFLVSHILLLFHLHKGS